MPEDQNREEPRFSRSGRVLKKTLKMKEMEDLEIEDGRQEKSRRRFIHPSKNHKRVENRAQCLAGEGRRESNSIGALDLSSSSDISGVDEIYSKPKKECHLIASNQKTLELHRLNDVYSSYGDKTWSTDVSSEDASSSSKSEGKSRECFDLHSEQCRFKKNSKRNHVKYHERSSLRHKAGSKTEVSKRSGIQTTKHSTAASTYYCLRKTANIEDMNKKLLFTELGKRLGGAYGISKEKKEAGYTEQDSLQHFENFSKERSNKRLKCDTDTNQLTFQEQQQSPELLVSNPVLGTASIDVAAHLVLLGDSLSKIGMTVANLNHIGPGVYSSLLDIILCSMGPLLCLTRDIDGLERLPEDTFLKILDHIAYIIPGI